MRRQKDEPQVRSGRTAMRISEWPVDDDDKADVDFVMNKIKTQISSEPEIREGQVAELKAKIKSGEYKVDSESLARKLLEDALNEDIV